MAKILAWFKEELTRLIFTITAYLPAMGGIKAFVLGTAFGLLVSAYPMVFPEPGVSTVIVGLLVVLIALIIILTNVSSVKWFWGLVVLALAVYSCFFYIRWQWAASKYSRASIVKLHFKESPLLTEQRRRFIQKEIDDFYEYLTRIGFGLSKEVPPLGVRKSMVDVSVTPGSIYEAGIYFPEADIDQPEVIRMVYAHHVFRKMFGIYSDPKVRFGSSTESIFADYYVSSFDNRNRNDDDDNKWTQAKWVNAMWNIRTEYGQAFADRLLFYVSEQWMTPSPNDEEFDKFFIQRFLAGLYVIDNAGHNESKIREILRKRGI